MKIRLFLVVSILSISISIQTLSAQNTSPYWSLAGNNNATATSKLGTTNVIPLRLFTNNAERVRIQTNGRVGIGTTSPANIFTVKATAGSPAAVWVTSGVPVFVGFAEAASSELNLSTASNTFDIRPVFSGKRSRGTLASPAVLINNDYITSLTSAAYDGSSFLSPAAINFYVDGTPSSGHVPARISFETGTSRSDRLERLKILNNGNFNFNNGQVFLQQSNRNVGIGTISPGSRLQVVAGYDGDGISVVGSDSGPKDAAFTLVDNAGHSGSLGLASANNAFMSGVVSGDIILSNRNGKIHFGTGAASGFPTMTVSGGNVGIGTTAPASPVDIVNAGAGVGINVNNTFIGNSDRVGVYSYSVQNPGYGYGMLAYGGRFGIYIGAEGGNSGVAATGVYANAYSSPGSTGTGYGVHGIATGGNNAYGIYGFAGGATFNAAGYFSGNLWASSYNTISDQKFKEEVAPLQNALAQLMKLRPSAYRFKQSEYARMNLPKGRQIGLIADEVKGVFPELVQQAVHLAEYNEKTRVETSPEIKYEGINYQGLIPVLIASVQELNKKNEELEARLKKLEALLTKGSNNTSITVSGA